ncbi:MAG: hypothetical protein WD904_07130 [Dehalococcoidia bacterium]
MTIGAFRIAWLILALLLAFVIFIECMADVGGSAAPIPHPTPTPALTRVDYSAS